MKKGKMHISPDGLHVLLIGSKGSLFHVDLRTRRTDSVRRLASPVRNACFYDNDTCYLISGRSGRESETK